MHIITITALPTDRVRLICDAAKLRKIRNATQINLCRVFYIAKQAIG